MSKNKKNLPKPVGKKVPSDYQSSKTSALKTEIIPTIRKN